MLKRTKETIRERQAECRDYLVRSGSLPAARKLALKEGHRTYQTSDWITALGQLVRPK